MATSKWPSMEDQLRDSKVTPGSALERLIRGNQDFHLLRPDEAQDSIRLPLWLRVHWRKGHPELNFSAIDPLGPYPDILFKIHARMLANHDLPGFVPGSPSGSNKGGTP
jgi:hypothetical protein